MTWKVFFVVEIAKLVPSHLSLLAHVLHLKGRKKVQASGDGLSESRYAETWNQWSLNKALSYITLNTTKTLFEMDLAKIEEEELALTPDEKRFLLDLEFVQSLANPSYLQCTSALNP